VIGIRYVDSHSHLIGRDREDGGWARAKLAKAAELGITVITIAQVPRLWDKTLELTSSFDNVFAVLGACNPEGEKLDMFEQLVKVCKEEPRIVGIGEIGLDYRQGKPPDITRRKEQLREHIQIAREVNLPIVIHDGKATEDILNILDEEAANDVGGMIHFFTGTPRQAEKAIEMGFSISFGGPHTYARGLTNLVKKVPLEYVMVETDSPLLAPPKGYSKRNRSEPSFVVDVVKGIAAIRGIDPEELRKITTQNAIRLFRLDEE
jgi:TatD DNase family protein